MMNTKPAPLHHLHTLKPVQITSFGKLSITIDGECLDVQNWKSPKVYQLLLLLVAAGGRNVSTDEVGDTIWPSQDAHQAMQNLEFILRRLRLMFQKKLPQHLKSMPILPLHHGKISFNDEFCDIDSWRLDAQIKQARALHRQGNLQQAHTMECHIIQSIQGSFMMGETELVYHHRQTWHTRLCSWIHATAALWQEESLQYHTHMMDLLDLGTQINPYSECLLRQRMEILHQAGYSNDAARYYQDWSSLLLQTFGLQPSKVTHQVYRSILSAQ